MTGVIFLASMSSFNTTIDLRGPSCLGRDAGSSRRVTPRSVWRSDPGFRTNDDPNCRTGRIQHVCPIGCERTLAFGPPAVPRQIQDEVVALDTAREVLLRVVDDAVHADRAQHVELPSGIHTGHFRSKRLGELKCERPHGATRAVDEDILSRLSPALVADTLDRERSGGGYGRGLFECDPGRLRFEPVFRDGRELGEGAAVAPQVPDAALTEDLVARPEAGHLRSDRLDMAGHISSGDAVFGLAQPGTEDAQDVRLTCHGMPDIGVDRRRANPDQHLVLPRRRAIDLGELEGVG